MSSGSPSRPGSSAGSLAGSLLESALAPSARAFASSRAGFGRAFALVVALAIFTAGFLLASPARAELQLDGRWRQGPLREDFSIQQWLEAGCGPPPQSTSTGGGEIVTIRVEGDELAIVGGGRVYRTNQCYDPMPTLRRESHSRQADGKTWRTRCVTPPEDPRKTVLNSLVVASSDTHIDLVETGRYEITIQNGRCMADVKRTRSFDLVRDEAAPATVAPPAPAPADPDPPEKAPASCSSPGEPTKLEVRPSKKLLRTGESFKFRGLVLDASGCQTRTATSWRVSRDSKGITIDQRGHVTVAADAPEGTVEIVATAAGKDARVAIEVVSPARYDELLARSGLNASGENDEASTASIATSTIGAGEGKVEDRARERRLLFLAIIGGVLAVLGVAAVVLARRARKAKLLIEQAEERHEARVQEVLDRRRRREAEHNEQMRAHEESVAASRRAGAGAAREKTCPACGREGPGGTTIYCPHDGTELVSPSQAALLRHPRVGADASGPPSVTPAKRGKICPTCGDRFDGGADYCGKDGTQLVLLN